MIVFFQNFSLRRALKTIFITLLDFKSILRSLSKKTISFQRISMVKNKNALWLDIFHFRAILAQNIALKYKKNTPKIAENSSTSGGIWPRFRKTLSYFWRNWKSAAGENFRNRNYFYTKRKNAKSGSQKIHPPSAGGGPILDLIRESQKFPPPIGEAPPASSTPRTKFSAAKRKFCRYLLWRCCYLKAFSL